MDQAFRDAMTAGYALDRARSVVIGSPMHDGELVNDARVQVALSMLNRHGLIAGATGTGKTKTLQLLAGQLSKAGVPVFVADIKGDLTGLAAPGDAANPKVQERAASLGWDVRAVAATRSSSCRSSGKLGAQVRATVHSFGPLLLGKVLDLNETQTSILALIFKYCDDNDLPLLDLKDLATTLKFLASDEGKPILEDYGGMSSASVGVLLRSIVVLEQEGADVFFGEPEFDVDDLLRTTPDGQGDHQRPRAVGRHGPAPAVLARSCSGCWPSCTRACPRPATCPKPKLCFFFDEAHLLFDDASEALMDQVERTARLIRSKGVGDLLRDPGADRRPVVGAGPARQPRPARAARVHAGRRRRAAQDGADVPDDRASTTSRRRITSLGIGEALVTVLSPRGVPTPLAATRLLPPDSLMAPIAADAFPRPIAASAFATKYGDDGRPRERPRDGSPARIAAARAAAAQAAEDAAIRAGVDPTTAGRDQHDDAGPAAARDRPPGKGDRGRRRRRPQREAERKRAGRGEGRRADGGRASRSIDTAIRTGGKVVTSKAGQDIIRGVFGTLFGGGKTPLTPRARHPVSARRPTARHWRRRSPDAGRSPAAGRAASRRPESSSRTSGRGPRSFRIPTARRRRPGARLPRLGDVTRRPLLERSPRRDARRRCGRWPSTPDRALMLFADGGPTPARPRADDAGDHDVELGPASLRWYAALQRTVEEDLARAAMRPPASRTSGRRLAASSTARRDDRLPAADARTDRASAALRALPRGGPADSPPADELDIGGIEPDLEHDDPTAATSSRAGWRSASSTGATPRSHTRPRRLTHDLRVDRRTDGPSTQTIRTAIRAARRLHEPGPIVTPLTALAEVDGRSRISAPSPRRSRGRAPRRTSTAARSTTSGGGAVGWLVDSRRAAWQRRLLDDESGAGPRRGRVARVRSASVSARIVATARLRNHFGSAGMTYHGAASVERRTAPPRRRPGSRPRACAPRGRRAELPALGRVVDSAPGTARAARRGRWTGRT